MMCKPTCFHCNATEFIELIRDTSGASPWEAGRGKLQEAHPATQGYSSVAEEWKMLPEAPKLAMVATVHQS